MPYLKLIKKAHECIKPTSIYGHRGCRNIGIGSVWMCPTCGKQWTVEKNVTPEAEKVLYWREMNVSEYLPVQEKEN